MPTLTEIENAFQPAREVDSAERFAGRRDSLSDAYFGLLGKGSNIAIVGNRGIGKSSLARQLSSIASGDNALLERLELAHDRPLDFMTVYFACGKSTTNVQDLLERLLTTSSCLGDWIYDIPNAKKELESYSPELSAKVFGVGVSLAGEKATEATSVAAVDKHTIDTVFTNVCAAIANEGLARDGLLIVIDEFDQVRDPTGMAGLMKSFASNVPKVKFCLVGVARDIQYLMKEHESADRLFAGSIVVLPPMTDDELTQIVRIAESAIDHSIRFSEPATGQLVRLAQGHPYMVHLVGKYALRTGYQNKIEMIEQNSIDDALRAIAERGADPVLEGRYKKAVGSSSQREAVLRALAKVRSADGECWTTDAYKIALDEGVDNSSQYVGQLVTEEYGAEIEKVRERYYRFTDSLLAAYVLARPRQFSKVEI
ncbi:nSTAND1 domain-containing NTPase [Dokdonella immobilis]|uniref:AAA ATPase domain-containing protein n=1 Tax=Dokdonella immobilis TaxID=578942 RepID=A0A1I5AXW8_9GAMM|nr:AAA family ATPase [Dokdonella immobilis]SFN67069.1 AAA ATPase domain-containing protein [Dokdonella immobilis]